MASSPAGEAAVAAAAEAELEALVLQGGAPRALDALERGAAPSSGGTGAGAALPAERLAAARGAYAQLQHAALRAVSDLAGLQHRVSALLVQAEAVRVQAEAEARGYTDPIQLIDQVREERDRAQREAAAAADSEEAARRQAESLAQRLVHLNSKLAEVEEERRAELEPEIKAAKDDVAMLDGQLEAERAKAEAAQRDAADIAARLEAIQLQIQQLHTALEEERDTLTKADLQPSRTRHLADLVVVAVRQLREEEMEAASLCRVHDAAEEAHIQEANQLVSQHAAAARANDKLRNEIAVRERAADEMARDIEMARVEAEKLLAEQVTLDLEVEKRKGEIRREVDALKSEQRARDVAQRRLNRAEQEAMQLQEQLPGLQNAVHNLNSQLAADQRQAAREAEATSALQAEVVGMLDRVAGEKKLTEVQAALVKASMVDVRQLEEENAALKAAVEERDTAIRAATSQRDGAVRFLNQRLHRLEEVIDEAETKDGEVEELHKKRREVKSAHGDLRDLCSLMSSQMGRFKTLLEYARKGAEDLQDKAQAAEEELSQLKERADTKGREVRLTERSRAAAQAEKGLLAGRLAAARRGAAEVAEAADGVEIERQLLARAAEEADEGGEQLAARLAAALAAKVTAQATLLERNEEMVGLFERSASLQRELEDGTVALQRCDDDMRLLQVEVAELQRSLFATHKTAPSVVSYDRQIAALKADVLRARKEADAFGAALESPQESRARLRMLPGKLPSREELEGRVATIEERLAARKDLAAQKDSVLEELERLTEGLVEKARASHDPGFDLAVRMQDARRHQQQLTRRMMATVSELSLYQALSLKFAADKDALAAELAEAKKNVKAGRPPTVGADMEFERQERDRQAEAEVRAQAAELRRLKADGLLGAVRSAASPRPQAYIPEEEGVPKPFPAAFRPFKPSDLPAAVALAAQKAAAVQQQQQEAAEQGQQAAEGMALGSGPASPGLVSVGPA